jgi:polysaccharide export outer membrane protein
MILLALVCLGAAWTWAIPTTSSKPPASAHRTPRTATHVVPWHDIRLCQALGPAAPTPIWGVDSTTGCGLGEVTWKARGPVNWQAFAQGEYVGHARLAHVSEYRIRVDDQMAFVYRMTHEPSDRPYELQVGDKIRVESLTGDAGAGGGEAQDNIRRELVVQPDGTISLPLLGQVRAAGMTVDGLRQHLEERYTRYYKVPAITVTPVEIDTRLLDLFNAVYARRANNVGGLPQFSVNPDGRIYLPGLSPICAQGMTVEELKEEIDARYEATIPGVDVTPIITQRAPRYVYVLGEVTKAGRYDLAGPTTLMGAIAMAGGWNTGANLRQIIVFRRGDDWRMIATMLDVQGALYGRRPAPADEIWLSDSDIVVVPKTPIRVANEFISQFFSNGLYAMFPQFSFGQFNFDNFRTISN